MKRIVSLALASALGASILTACGGGHGSIPSVQPAPVSSPYTGPSTLSNFSWGSQYVKAATYVGPATFKAASVNVLVKMRDEAGLLRYASDVSTPGSPVYRHFLTPQEIADRFGASQSDYAQAAGYFSKFGMHVGGWAQRQVLFVVGSQAQLESAFGTKFGVYRLNNATFIAPIGTPHFQTAMPITAVSHLVALTPQHSYLMRGVPNSWYRGYSPQQIARAFDFTGAYQSGYHGEGINVGIIGTGPISSADATTLGNLYNAPMGKITQMPVTDSGVTQALGGEPLPTPAPVSTGTPQPVPGYPYSSGLQTPPPVTAPCDTSQPLSVCNPEDGEAQLDTESVASLAPGANTLFYLAYNPNDCTYTTGGAGNTPCQAGSGLELEGLYLFDVEIQQVIADNEADAVSISIGGGEPLNDGFYFNDSGQGFGPVEYATLASEGIAVFVSSGDTGAYECSWYMIAVGLPQYANQKCASYPATDPSVVSVGGVNVALNDSTKLPEQMTAWGYSTQLGGDGTFGNNVGSGGGPSYIFKAPSWQAAVPATLSGGFRATPDVSLDADPSTGPTIVLNAQWGGTAQAVVPIGGTSAAAPEMAAMWALVLQACKQTATCSTATGAHPYRLGNPNPLFYAIYGQGYKPTGFTPQLAYNQVFYDVTYGDNSAYPGPTPTPSISPAPASTPMPGFQSGTGYDLVTGLGAPMAGHLIQAITGAKTP